jgi:hypothetical protein
VAVGVDSSDAKGLVEVSSNGGKTFTDEPVPVGTPQLNAVTCNDLLHCIAVGGSTVLVSPDGGMSWTSEFAGQYLSTVTCISDSVCLAGGWAGAGGSFQFKGSAVVTSDGGTTWQESLGLSPSLASTSCTGKDCIGLGPLTLATSADNGLAWQRTSYFNDLTSVACLPSTSTCLMFGPNSVGMNNPSTPPYAYLTNDDGRTVTDISSEFPTGSWSIEDVSCASSNTCYAFGGVGFVSTDSGNTWTSVNVPSGLTPFEQYGDGEGFQWLSCASANTCVMVGKDSSGPMAAFTTNSATSWSLASSIG